MEWPDCDRMVEEFRKTHEFLRCVSCNAFPPFRPTGVRMDWTTKSWSIDSFDANNAGWMRIRIEGLDGWGISLCPGCWKNVGEIRPFAPDPAPFLA